MSMTNSLASTLLNAYYTTPTLYLGLHSADPTQTGNAGTEITGGSYARQRIIFGAPSNRAVVNTNQIVYLNLPATTVTFLAIWTAVSGGVINHTLLVTSIVVSTGGTFVIPVTDVAVVLA